MVELRRLLERLLHVSEPVFVIQAAEGYPPRYPPNGRVGYSIFGMSIGAHEPNILIIC